MVRDRFSVRLPKFHQELLRKLTAHMGMDEANTMRLALLRLAQLEGIVKAPPLWEMLREKVTEVASKPEDEEG